MGGDQERVEIYLNAHPKKDQTEARRLLTEQFATFDAGKARCFLASDREHLLAVIEAGFGDFDDFNRVARNLFVSRLHDELVSSRSGSPTRRSGRSTGSFAPRRLNLSPASPRSPWSRRLLALQRAPLSGSVSLRSLSPAMQRGPLSGSTSFPSRLPQDAPL